MGNGRRSSTRGPRVDTTRGRGPSSWTSRKSRPRRRRSRAVVLTVVNVALATLFAVLVTIDRMKIGRELALPGEEGSSWLGGVTQEVIGEEEPAAPSFSKTGAQQQQQKRIRNKERAAAGHQLQHMLLADIDAGSLWKDLVVEGGQLLLEATSTAKPKLGGIEIGMHRANQCMFGAKHGLRMMCFEPSPPNYQRVIRALRQRKRQLEQKQQGKQSPDTPNNIRVYNLAVGNTTGNFINFEYSADPKGIGNTGDHVGNNIDMWNMMMIFNNNNKTTSTTASTNSSILPTKETIKTQVKTVRLDDIIMVQGGSDIVPSYSEGLSSWDDHDNQNQDNIYVAKIDTQGYEPAVFEGMKQTILSHKIQFIITEFWPKGMDLIHHGSTDNQNACQVPVQMLQLLLKANYTLYATKVESHPLAPKSAKQIMNTENRPPMILSDNNLLMDHCMYYRYLEERFPSDSYYKMGYWTDILAISPNARLPSNPTTDIGKRLQGTLLQQ